MSVLICLTAQTNQNAHVVYSVPCGEYLDQSKRQFGRHLTEHQKAVSNLNKTNFRRICV
jgi:hypothetical protein